MSDNKIPKEPLTTDIQGSGVDFAAASSGVAVCGGTVSSIVFNSDQSHPPTRENLEDLDPTPMVNPLENNEECIEEAEESINVSEPGEINFALAGAGNAHAGAHLKKPMIVKIEDKSKDNPFQLPSPEFMRILKPGNYAYTGTGLALAGGVLDEKVEVSITQSAPMLQPVEPNRQSPEVSSVPSREQQFPQSASRDMSAAAAEERARLEEIQQFQTKTNEAKRRPVVSDQLSKRRPVVSVEAERRPVVEGDEQFDLDLSAQDNRGFLETNFSTITDSQIGRIVRYVFWLFVETFFSKYTKKD